jgi:hypothetical protein
MTPDLTIVEKIRAHLIESLLEVQRQSGREVPSLGDDSVPFDDLPGFDSINGVEAEVLLSERLAVDLKHLPFLDEGDRHLTVGEIARAVAAEIGAQLQRSRVSDPGGSEERP